MLVRRRLLIPSIIDRQYYGKADKINSISVKVHMTVYIIFFPQDSTIHVVLKSQFFVHF